MNQKPLQKLRVGVFLGGNSSERAISLRSGKAVSEALTQSGLSVTRIDPKDWPRAQKAARGIDTAFLALHGRGGEDGKIQERLEKKGIPYVGSNPRASRLAFEKVQAKKVFEREGISTPPWLAFTQRDWRRLEGFRTPFFVKPSADGSSIGVFLVEDFNQSAEKIKQAVKKYPMLLAEKRIVGREFTVGILGDRVLPVIELRPKREFYDYRAKYTPGMTEYLVPAPIPHSWRRRFQQIALRVHKALGLRDLSRVDMMADSKGKAFVLEANTIPGFTELSLLPKAAKEAGISFQNLCLRLVEMAWRRRNGKT